MNSTNTQKKRQTVKDELELSLHEPLIELEDICARLLETRFATRDDSERMYWQQRFKNIVTPVSLALAEIRGPRRFHHHYRHDADDDSKLLPVLENPIDMLAHACEYALQQSSKKLSGIHDDDLIAAQRVLERSLNNFLLKYQQYQQKW